MTFNEKLRIILKNNGWTQTKLAHELGFSKDAVYTWVHGISRPDDETKLIICELFAVPIQELLYDHFEIPEYRIIGTFVPYAPKMRFDSIHTVIDADLAGNALLHRFTKNDVEKCSAIYIGDYEEWWHYREQEPWMIRHWNEEHGDVRRAY